MPAVARRAAGPGWCASIAPARAAPSRRHPPGRAAPASPVGRHAVRPGRRGDHADASWSSRWHSQQAAVRFRES